MAGKKKKGKGKGKKKKKDGKKGPTKPVIPNFIPTNPLKSPIAVKIHHFDDIFLIYSDEYHLAGTIHTELEKILNIPSKHIKLYFSNKRLVEVNTVLHDQQIINNVDLYMITIKEQGPPEVWESIKDVIAYNIYDVNVDELKIDEEEEVHQQQQQQTKTKTKKKATGAVRP